jgi:uncharacterized membrane protein YuzA (DUF378 family)
LVLIFFKGLLLTNYFTKVKSIYMSNGKFFGGMCSVSMVCKLLLVVGGLNWGLVGLGMFLGNDLNVVHMLVGSWPTLEAVVYLLVGVAAVMKLFGCRCSKCMAGCASCGATGMDQKM